MISTRAEAAPFLLPLPPPNAHLSYFSSSSSSSASSSSFHSMIEISPPPPAYRFPTSPPSPSPSPSNNMNLNPLSFYPFSPFNSRSQNLPFSTLTPTPATVNSSSTSTLGSSDSPPEYNQVPQTLSERCFVFGFIFPFLWIIGFSKYFYSERRNSSNFPIQVLKELEVEGALEEMERERILESLKNWRQEEKLWSLRCGYSLIGFVSVGSLVGIVISAVIGKL
ncbi:hypothetical protein JCM3765_004041 [Sporobolomyces pararoseus]